MKTRTIFLVGLACLSPLLMAGGRAAPEAKHPGRNGALTERERQVATIAWRYFDNNFNPDTCLVNSVDNYPSTTMWDLASSIGALVSAKELGVTTEEVFHHRVRCLLVTLEKLELYHGELPNKVYNTRTATMANFANEPGEVGFSAIDVGRLLIWLRILAEREPYYAPAINSVVARWHFCNVLDRCGTMYGAAVTADTFVYLQEGRLGYEEYAAKGYQLWGFNTAAASKIEPLAKTRISGVDIPYDSRDPRLLGAHSYVVTESYALDGLELGWDRADDRTSDDATYTDRHAAEFAGDIYRVQEARHKSDGILTARTEHQLDVAPWFVYDTIYSDGYPWNTITDDGRFLPASAAVSTKAAFSLWALWETPYTDLLQVAVLGQFDPERGYFEGVYEATGAPIRAFTANTNGIILETLLHKVQGKLLRFGDPKLASWVEASSKDVAGECHVPARQRAPCGPAEPRE